MQAHSHYPHTPGGLTKVKPDYIIRKKGELVIKKV